jgi:hypothetical protein
MLIQGIGTLFEGLLFVATNPWLYIWLWSLFVTFISILMMMCCMKHSSEGYRSKRARAWLNQFVSKNADRFRMATVAKPPQVNNAFFKAQTPDTLHTNALSILELLRMKELQPQAQHSLQRLANSMFGEEKYCEMFAKYLVKLHPALHREETVIETVNDQGDFRHKQTSYTLLERFVIASTSNSEGGCHAHCPFHSETLLVHLFAAAYYAMVSSAKTNESDPYYAFITALFHDCVKAETNKKHDEEPCMVHGKAMGLCDHEDTSAQCKCARYPAHGLLGAMYLSMFSQHIVATMSNNISARDKIAWFNAMVRTVQIHMSLHSCTDSDVCTRVLTPEGKKVKQLCLNMFVGDNLGKIPHSGFESEESFSEKHMKFWYNVKSLKEEAQPLQILNKEGKIIINLCGLSGAGKTSFGKRIFNMLSSKHHPVLISRDQCICEVMTGQKVRLTGQVYADMYKAYAAVRKYHSDHEFEELEEVLAKYTKILAPTFHKLKKDKVPEVDKDVNKLFNEKLTEALNDQLKSVLIVDTLMNLWKVESEKLVFTGDHIKIDVPVLNLSSVISSSNGLEPKEQLRLSKSSTLLKPAGGEFNSNWFNSFLHKPYCDKYQAPPVILTDSNGVPCEVGWDSSLQWLLNAIGKSPIVSKYVDSNTASLNGKEFMIHLIKKCKGHMLEVRHILYDKYDCNMNGICAVGKDTKMSVTQKAKCVHQLVEYTKLLHNNGILERPFTEEELDSNDKLFWNTLFSIPTLRYKDTFVGEKFWVNNFMLKYRGLNLFIHPITGEVTDLRFLMDRGAEIHSKITKGKAAGQDDGVTNHGINLNKIKDALDKSLAINGYLTQKADGSLASFTVYTGNALKVMYAYVQIFGTELAKEIANKSMEMSKGKYMIILATQGTKSITEDMVSFATTSIFGGIYENGRPLLSREDFGDKTPLMLWKEHGEKVLQRVYALHASAYAKHPDESITLIFEMVCANRRDAFGGKAHEEFACQSTKDQFLFLGLGYSCEETIPHCVVDTNGLFRQPAYWKIIKSSQVNDMIRDLQKVMIKEMSQEEFIELYPPVNPEEFDSLHPEGFCFWAYVDKATTLLHTAFGLPGILTYSKVKTLIYYQGHKVKVENINELVEFGSRVNGLIPKADTMYAIYSSGKLEELLLQLHEEYLRFVDITRQDSLLRSIILDIYGPVQQVHENVAEGGAKKKKFTHPFEFFEYLRNQPNKVAFCKKPKAESVSKSKAKKTKSTKKDKPKVEDTHIDRFVKAMMNKKMISSTDHNAMKLLRTTSPLFTHLFITRWNEMFGTEIQTLDVIAKLKEDGVNFPFSDDGRTQFEKRVRVSEVVRSILLKEILLIRPWNMEALAEISSCKDIPSLLEVDIIKLMIKLMNMEKIYIPSVSEQVISNDDDDIVDEDDDDEGEDDEDDEEVIDAEND